MTKLLNIVTCKFYWFPTKTQKLTLHWEESIYYLNDHLDIRLYIEFLQISEPVFTSELEIIYG